MFEQINYRIMAWVILAIIFLVCVIFAVTCFCIGYGVQQECVLVQAKYDGKCVQSLMSFIADESSNYGKNKAIWALGQLGDGSALSFLQQYDTGEKLRNYESWDEGISQYELRKAIKLLNGGHNLSSWIWRPFVLIN